MWSMYEEVIFQLEKVQGMIPAYDDSSLEPLEKEVEKLKKKVMGLQFQQLMAKSELTPPEALFCMGMIANNVGDQESDHINADEVLVKLLIFEGHRELVEKYSEIDKWYA